MDEILLKLKLNLKFTELKEQQAIVINKLLENKHVFAILPTGYGKSECFGLFSAIKDQVRYYSYEHTCMYFISKGALQHDYPKLPQHIFLV